MEDRLAQILKTHRRTQRVTAAVLVVSLGVQYLGWPHLATLGMVAANLIWLFGP